MLDSRPPNVPTSLPNLPTRMYLVAKREVVEYVLVCVLKLIASIASAASMWAVMHRFGYKHLPSELNGADTHRQQILLTLSTEVHNMFDELDLWFERIDTPHTHNVRWADPWLISPTAP
ncbi:hypothetical protein F5I97DRAFT_1647695 [Phlebopus sp. FC_14]|nr:hypothetical protein F5I97DRAFT_1647695 [Phlebopus sp. FC_14]